LTVSNARVSLVLPAGSVLPVALDLNVMVEDTLPVALDVRAIIPIEDTQLHDVATSLRLVLEPIAVGMVNLPNNFGEAFTMIGDVLGGNPPNLLAPNAYSLKPWQGFSRTAGLNYPLELLTAPVPQPNVPIYTGIVPIGGIPLLDETVRPQLYDGDNTPASMNAQILGMITQIPAIFYNGQYGDYRRQVRQDPLAPDYIITDPNPPVVMP